VRGQDMLWKHTPVPGYGIKSQIAHVWPCPTPVR
jgi:hypothetical protein